MNVMYIDTEIQYVFNHEHATCPFKEREYRFIFYVFLSSLYLTKVSSYVITATGKMLLLPRQENFRRMYWMVSMFKIKSSVSAQSSN